MKYSTIEVTLVKVYDLTPEQSRDLREKLRLERLNGNCGLHITNLVGDKNYTGLLSLEEAKKVQDWLIQNGATVKE